MSKVIDRGNSTHPLIHNSNDVALLTLEPRAFWREMHEREHCVQFYESNAFLLNSLSGFVCAALEAGEAAIVIATKAVRESLEERLHTSGVNVMAARSAGEFVSLDAAETLSKLMVTGLPQPERVREVIGEVIASAAKNGRRVRIFGEMVALSWAEGNYAGAIRLEELWNDLQRTHPFSLLCAYPMKSFDGDSLALPLGEVCAGHTRVIPAESYTSLTNTDERLRAITLLQQKANSLQALKDQLELQVEDNARLYQKVQRELEEREQLLVREQMARAEAESANRMKDEFLATVSHELRTPLTAIMGWTYMIRRCNLDETTLSRAIETIDRNAQAQAQLVEDLLDVSRVVTGNLRLNVSNVDMALVINAAIDSVQLAADSKGILLEVSLNPSARHVSGDASRLQQVVWNLLSNAIRFTPSGGRVCVRLERSGSSAQISVSDTGCGIDSDFLPFVFDRFRQADGSTTRRHGGLGLGLAIVRHLVELHGGAASVDSLGEGCGATFTITLPLVVNDERVKERQSLASEPLPKTELGANPLALQSLDGVRVLLVDDNQDTLKMLTAMLMESKATIQTASNVSEALDLLQLLMPDVIVSDLALPFEDGYSLIAKVRKLEAASGKQIPAVALTAYIRVEDRAKALAAGFNMFVPKPVEPNELVAAISHLTKSGAVELS